MSGNSFETHDGSHVGGVVAMAPGKDGKATPIEPFTLEQLCRALAFHGALCSGKKADAESLESAAQQMIAFAKGGGQ